MQHNNIKTLASTLTSARDWLEQNEELKGYVTIEACSSFSLHHGEMEIKWKVSHVSGTVSTIDCQFLEDGLEELLRRRRIEKRMAPLSLPRVAERQDKAEAASPSPEEMLSDEVPF